MDTKTKWFRCWRIFVFYLSSEWVLTHWRIPNGGAVVLFRTLISSVGIFFLTLVLFNIVNPQDASWEVVRMQIVDRFTWFGVIFAALYTGLYARFSSQWTYLANLYNSIKQTECSNNNRDVLAEWKAGFIEDAEDLHMAGKTTFVSIIRTWLGEEHVRRMFIEYAPGGERRFNRLVEKVEDSIKLVEAKYER